MDNPSRHLCALALATLLAAATPTAHAQTAASESASQVVAEAAQLFFDAMALRDTTALIGILHPDAVLIAIGPDNVARVERGDIREWVRGVGQGGGPWRERFTETPRVEIDGPLATVWARYDFHLGDRFSHCGTDAFQFVRDGDAWRLLVVTFSVELEGCESSAAP